MNRVIDCVAALKKANLSVEIPGFTNKEAGDAFCYLCRYDASYDGNITKELIQKTLSSKWPSLEKSVLGGIQHLVSVDNAGNYAELWYKGGSYYAVTGAELSKSLGLESGFYMIEGITKGMSISDAVPRFAEALFGPLK